MPKISFKKILERYEIKKEGVEKKEIVEEKPKIPKEKKNKIKPSALKKVEPVPTPKLSIKPVPSPKPFVIPKEVQVVCFKVADEEYGINILNVVRVVENQETTPLPHLPSFVLGVIHLLGKVVPVIDLKKRLNISSTHKPEMIIIVKIGNEEVGVLVDVLTGIVKLAESDQHPLPHPFADREPGYLTGIGRLDNRIIILLDVEQTLKPSEVEELSVELRKTTGNKVFS